MNITDRMPVPRRVFARRGTTRCYLLPPQRLGRMDSPLVAFRRASVALDRLVVDGHIVVHAPPTGALSDHIPLLEGIDANKPVNYTRQKSAGQFAVTMLFRHEDQSFWGNSPCVAVAVTGSWAMSSYPSN
jgi:hypothetical protein